MIAMLEQYLEWRRVRNYAERTIRFHRNYLRYFINWCAVRGVTQPAEVTKPIIERYQHYMYPLPKGERRSLELHQPGRAARADPWMVPLDGSPKFPPV